MSRGYYNRELEKKDPITMFGACVGILVPLVFLLGWPWMAVLLDHAVEVYGHYVGWVMSFI